MAKIFYFRTPRLASSVTLCGLTLAMGCAPEAAPPADAVRIDSAGTEIVDNRAPAITSETAWVIPPSPTLRIGADERDSTQLLHGVFRAVRLTNGTVVIATSTTPSLRWYSPDGRLLVTNARRGRGPGEYSGGHLRLWRLPGDSVAVWENSLRRLQVFTPKGHYARSGQIQSVLGRHPFAIGLFSDNTILVYPSESLPRGTAAGQVVRGTYTFVRVALDGSIVNEVGLLPGQENLDLRNPPMPGLYPFSRQPVFTVHDDMFYYAVPTHYSIEVRDATGSLKRIIRRSAAMQPLTSGMISRFEEKILADLPSDRARAVRTFLDQTPYPDSVPAFGRIVLDTDGNVWVQEYSPNATMPGYPDIADTLTWSVFDNSGRWVTDVRLPSGLMIHDAGSDYILGLSRTAFDTEVVELYPIVKDAQSVRR